MNTKLLNRAAVANEPQDGNSAVFFFCGVIPVIRDCAINLFWLFRYVFIAVVASHSQRALTVSSIQSRGRHTGCQLLSGSGHVVVNCISMVLAFPVGGHQLPVSGAAAVAKPRSLSLGLSRNRLRACPGSLFTCIISHMIRCYRFMLFFFLIMNLFCV